MHEAEVRLLSKTAEGMKALLDQNYVPGFGVVPSANPKDNFYAQMWARDFAHAAGNYFIHTNPQAVADSFMTLFCHQRASGELPFRVEREYMLLKVIPGLRSLSRPLFNLIEGKIKHRSERPVFEGQDFSGAEDTIPLVVIAAGEFFCASRLGRMFITTHFESLVCAVDWFWKKTDLSDGLVSVQPMNPDWADSLKRGGKLGGMNVWWARALRLMAMMSSVMGHKESAKRYSRAYRRVKNSIYEKLYDSRGGFIRACAGEDRLETVASIYGALYLFDADEAIRLQDTLARMVKRGSGLENYHPPYTKQEILLPHRFIGHGGYHNEYVWPWVTCQNICVKIKIVREHNDVWTRHQYKQEAMWDLLDIAFMFKDAGGVYEIFNPGNRQPAISRWYKPPKNFMGSMAAFMGAYRQMKRLSWI